MTLPVLLFAAGFGTRMKPLTNDRPKPLVEVDGKPLIDHALALAQDVSPPLIAANLHYKARMLDAHLAPLGVQTITETPDILDTGGGLRNALPVLGPGPVITMNTDAIWSGPNPVKLLLAAWDPTRMDALMSCIPVSRALEHDGNGDFSIDDTGRLSCGPGLVYGGVQIIKTEGLAHFREPAFSLNLLWRRMEAEGRLFGLDYPGRWCDVGHPGGIKTAERLIHGDV
ncbi:nucleotidyltransferase family protein [Sulfitobacter sp. HNIBRBA3233]|uniref:nucleotidyltransferase family protein n=1 Tax=Sulfitobacter marinivivus TaxID=3158558 RepID=UPI0032DE7C4D